MLGVYHMANPGRDVFNMQSDDARAPRRQAEIAQVVAALKKFHPTKIAVERDAGDARVSRDYADNLAGKHELTRDEVEQIGFRLATGLGAMMEAQGAYLASHTVLETLLFMSFDAGVAGDPSLRLRKRAELVE